MPKGSEPHDVAPAPDGTVWYTAQPTGELGRLTPTTGAMHAIALGDGSAPHGVIIGPDGAPWVTDGGLNAIVRVDPTTLNVKRYPLPANRRNANLNTATFDAEVCCGSPGKMASTAGSTRHRRDAGLRRAARRGPVRDQYHAGRFGLLCLPCRQLYRPD